MSGIHELAFAVDDFRDTARDGRPVDVHIEDIQKDADAGFRGINLLDRDDLAISRGDHDVTRRRDTVRIAEEVETEGREHIKGDAN